jgi:hypothetical protein
LAEKVGAVVTVTLKAQIGFMAIGVAAGGGVGRSGGLIDMPPRPRWLFVCGPDRIVVLQTSP